LGNSAFKNTKATYAGSAKLPAALEARKDFYETNFREILGEAYGDAEFIAPTKLVEVGESVSIDLGERSLTLIAYPTAHTDNDLVVIDNNTKTLWTGDLLFVQRIPALDGSINGWIRVMDELAKLEFNTVIPGHGPVLKGEWKSALALQKQYFTHVREQVREIIFDMGTITQATTEVGLGENKDWLLHEEYHKRNVTSSFTELEWE
jgi:glyoxylase-like metal-dependent hydrolase (beta-lactamase superfamily II)